MPQEDRLFVFTVSGRGMPPERYEITGFGFDLDTAEWEAAERYRIKYNLSVIGPAFDIKFENPDA